MVQGQSFETIIEHEVGLALSRAECFVASDAGRRASERILEGFRDVADAVEYVKGLGDKDLAFYDAWGYPISCQAVLDAVDFVKQNKGGERDE